MSAAALDRRLTLNAYAPTVAVCPTTALVRPATGISSSEHTYITTRKAKADTSLAAWLKRTNSGFSTSSLPTVGLTVSGGGLRSLLCGAGVIQGFDSRDSNVGTSGIFQSLTYQAGLSGGSWLTSSIAGNNWPTITQLKANHWEQGFLDTLLVPAELLSALAYDEIVNDIVAKGVAGYPPTIVDAYGRLLSYQLLDGAAGGVNVRLSGLTSLSNFTSQNVPYPIITSRGVDTFDGDCVPDANATQYEFHPYEFGSWDAGVSAFTQTAYLGSKLTNGSPNVIGVCTKNYDNLGYVMGTSSDIFNAVCSIIPAQNNTNSLAQTLEGIVDKSHTPATRDLYGVYPNPFYGYSRSSHVSAQKELDLTDGGEAGQNNPIWPFIQSARSVDVLIVNDNSADTTDLFPNGTEILTTYEQAQAQGLTKMPFIPSVATFVSEGLNKRATFFGCNDDSVVTIVYLPNVNYTYASNTSTDKIQYSKADTDGIIANGVSIADQNGDSEWPTCLACAIMQKTGSTLPSDCTACFDKYCYAQ